MPRKISEYFKVTPKSQNSENCVKSVNFSENGKLEILSETPDCQVIIKDIKVQLPKNLKLFTEISSNILQTTGNKLIEKGQTKCEFYGKEPSDRSSLRKHIKLLHSDELNLLNCSICSQKFFQQKFSDIHLKAKHPDGQVEQFECDFDGKVFKTRANLYNHIKSHISSVECKICQKVLKSSSLGSHMSHFHSTEKNFQCQICSKNFKSNLYLKNHTKVHNKKFECDICKKMYSSNGVLNTHKKNYHVSVDSIECEVCGKKFYQNAHLKSHQKTHDKNRLKPYKCQRCNYETDDKRSFIYHQNSHENRDKKYAAMKNPLKCEYCPTFHRNRKHLRSHIQ